MLDLFVQLWQHQAYLAYLSGMTLTLLGMLLCIVPVFSRRSMALIWASIATVMLGFSRFAQTLGIIFDFSFMSYLRIFFEVFAAIAFTELLRRNLAMWLKKRLSKFWFHLPFLIVFILLAVFNNGVFVGYGRLVTGLVLFLCCIALVRNGRDLPLLSFKVVLVTMFLTSALVFGKIMLSVPSLNDYAGPSVGAVNAVSPILFLQILVVISLCFCLLLARFLHDRSSRHYGIGYYSLILSLLIFLLLLFVNFGGIVIGEKITDRARLQLNAEIETSIEGFVRMFRQRVAFATTASRLLSTSPIISQYLSGSDEGNAELVTSVLEAFAVSYPDAICYIVDSTGQIAITSREAETILGRDVSFRKYFSEGMAGSSLLMMGFGVYTKELGIYSAEPVFDPAASSVVGVCVVKRDLKDIESYLKRYHPALLIDAENRILFASKPELIGKKLVVKSYEDLGEGTVEREASDSDTYVLDERNSLYKFAPALVDGAQIVFLRSAVPIIESHNQILLFVMALSGFLIAVLGIIIVGSESYRKIKQAQDQFKSVFYSAPESIFIVDCHNLSIMAANESMIKQFNFDQSVVGVSFKELLHKENYAVRAATHDIAAGTFSHERAFVRQNQAPFTAEVTGARTTFNGRRAVLLSLHDITLYHQTENELRRAKEVAEEVSRIKSRFLANTSHEIRTPMTAIIGLTELARSYCADDEQHRILDLVRESGQSLLELVNDILELSFIESAKLKIKNSEFNLIKMLSNLVELIRFRTDQQLVDVELKIDSSVPEWILADKYRIRQILLNLMTNSHKYTSEGHITLAVNLIKSESSQDLLEFVVADTGTGISPEMQQRLFEAFSYDNNTSYDSERSTGLGLTISKQLSELLGGTLSLENSSPEGTQFRVVIPCVRCERDHEQGGNIPALHNIRLLADSRPLNFLVVDDNETNLFLASSIIEQHEGKCDSAKDGLEALEKLENDSYDLILLDIQMPRLDGIGVIRAVRSSSKPYAKIPIIAVSAFATDKEKAFTIQVGAHGYLSKPYYPEELLQLIKTVLGLVITAPEGVKSPHGAAKRSSAPNSPKAQPQQLLQIDEKELGLRILNKPENLRHISDIFARRSVELVNNLDKCVLESDLAALRDVVHSIKGLAGMLAAKHAYDVAFRLERLAQEGADIQIIQANAATLKDQLNEIARDLKLLANKSK